MRYPQHWLHVLHAYIHVLFPVYVFVDLICATWEEQMELGHLNHVM